MSEIISIPTSEQIEEIIALMQSGPSGTSNYDFVIEKVDTSVASVYTVNRYNGIIWARVGVTLRKSTDNGETWVQTGTIRVVGTTAFDVMRQLKSGTLIAASSYPDSKIYRSTDEGATWTEVFNWNANGLGVNSYTLGQAMDEDPNYDGNGNSAFYIGEYTANASIIEGKKMRIIRSTDEGATWVVHYEEPHYTADGIRHWHFIQYDEFDKQMWAGTGDIPNHCKVFNWKGLNTPTYFGGNTYDWKFVSIAIDKNVVFCPSDRTDVGISEICPVYMFSKQTGKLSIIGYNDSQAWYSCFNNKYRLPFWMTQVNVGGGNTSFIQGYTADYYGTYEVLRLPTTIGNNVTPSSRSFSYGDFIYILLMGNEELNPGTTAFVRIKITPKF